MNAITGIPPPALAVPPTILEERAFAIEQVSSPITTPDPIALADLAVQIDAAVDSHDFETLTKLVRQQSRHLQTTSMALAAYQQEVRSMAEVIARNATTARDAGTQPVLASFPRQVGWHLHDSERLMYLDKLSGAQHELETLRADLIAAESRIEELTEKISAVEDQKSASAETLAGMRTDARIQRLETQLNEERTAWLAGARRVAEMETTVLKAAVFIQSCNARLAKWAGERDILVKDLFRLKTIVGELPILPAGVPGPVPGRAATGSFIPGSLMPSNYEMQTGAFDDEEEEDIISPLPKRLQIASTKDTTTQAEPATDARVNPFQRSRKGPVGIHRKTRTR